MVRFSSRIHWSLEPSGIGQAVAEARTRGGLLDLTQSNPTDAGLQYPADLLAPLSHPRSLAYEPLAEGLLSAREAVSGYYAGAVDPAHILLTASTSEAYSWLFKLLCNPGDEILVPRPSYPLFEFLAHLESVRPVQYPMHWHDGWFIDLDALARSVTERTRAIVFVNPNNPTGSFLKHHEYDFIAGVCERHGLALISDEVFTDFAFGEDESRIATLAGRSDVLTFTLSGLSKVCGLPQLKLGWIAASGPEAHRHNALQRLELIADTFLSVGTPVQHALPMLLNGRHAVQDQIRARTAASLAYLREAAAGANLRLLQPEAGWYATLQAPRQRTEEEWILHLLGQHGVLVQPGFFYDFETEAYLVLSLLTEPAEFSEGVRRIILAARGISSE